MKKYSTAQVIFILILSVSTMGAANFSFASGSFSTSSGNTSKKPYNHGKAVLYKKVVCKICPLPNKSVSHKAAKEIVMAMNNNNDLKNSLSMKERDAVVFYLNKRYELN